MGLGTSNVFEWAAVATVIVEHKDIMYPGKKLRYLKNSLVKNALTLISTSDMNNQKELIELISMTYGVAHTT